MTQEFPDLMIAAADEIERLTGETSHWMDEAVRLQNMKANLHSHIKRLEDENTKLTSESVDTHRILARYVAEIAKLREALENIDQHPNLKATAFQLRAIARAALQKDEGK